MTIIPNITYLLFCRQLRILNKAPPAQNLLSAQNLLVFVNMPFMMPLRRVNELEAAVSGNRTSAGSVRAEGRRWPGPYITPWRNPIRN